MVRNYHLDLDNLESPLVSPSPLTSVGGIPGSAIAEKIFNDPDSWDNPLGEFGHNDLEMQWLAEEVEKLKRLSLSTDEREVVLSMEQNNLILRAFPDHYKVTRLQDDSHIASRSASVYGGIQQDVTGPLVLSPLPRTGIQGDSPDGFTKLWQSKGLRPPSPLNFSPPSSTGSSEEFGISVQQPSPLPTPSSKVASASTTWSFLEWYGIHPGSPGKEVKSAAMQAKKSKPRPRGILQGSTALSHALSQPPTSPPKVPLPPIPAQPAAKLAETPAADRPSSAVRRLPAVPPSVEPTKASFPETVTSALPRPPVSTHSRRPSTESVTPVLPRRSSPALPTHSRRPSADTLTPVLPRRSSPALSRRPSPETVTPVLPRRSSPALSRRPSPETVTPVLPRRSSPALSTHTRRPSEPVAGIQSTRLLMERRPSEPYLLAIPTPSSRVQSIRSPPPAGPRPKGFVPRGRESSQGSRTPSRSPLRTAGILDGI